MKRPVSTYRLQLHEGFGFADAARALDYLERLGVTDVYTSPYLQAEPHSTHGYNVVSHTTVNAELGGREGLDAFTDDLKARGLGHILDVVPNHMGIAAGDNAWWNDVLENGPASIYAGYFDILWNPPKVGLQNKVLLPVLGDQYGAVLERGELVLEREGGRFAIRYWERRLPVAPKSLLPLLERAVEASGLAPDEPSRQELESLIAQLRNMPGIEAATDPTLDAEAADALRAERHRENEVFKRRLEALCGQEAAVCRAIDEVVAATNGTPGEPASFDDLDALLRAQHYRLAFWRVATEEINYRRFFDINELAALRMEDPKVFEAAHALVFELIDEGRVTGLRLDHTDGLYDPVAYFRALQAARSAQLRAPSLAGGGGGPVAEPAEPEVMTAPNDRPLYVVAEKILEPGEQLPTAWPIHGTTGYDFIALAGGLFVDPAAEAAFDALYERFTDEDRRYPEILLASKRLIMQTSLSSEIHVLAQRLESLAEGNRRSRDFTRASLTLAITETIAAFPVYRTYVREDGTREGHDDEYIRSAVRLAKRRNPGVPGSVFDYLGDVLTLQFPPDATDAQRAEQAAFALKFQQVTSPVMAKGAEDTAFYNYHRLIALNEVGNDPAHFATSIETFHAGNRLRLAHWPLSMLASSTHDTKRGEDTRARVAVLSELPHVWRSALAGFSRLAKAKKTTLDGEPAPSRNDEYLFYQTVLGAWPLDGNSEGFTERIQAYMGKAAKEAKRHTSWVNPNEAYDEALSGFVAAMLADKRFTTRMAALHARISPYGAVNGLAATLLKLTAPGVPDTYQGAERWNQSLVDPDNRRPVDYARHAAMLDALDAGATDMPALAAELLERYEDGAVKLHVTRQAMALRREASDLFLDGAYVPLASSDHVVAFARMHEGRAVITAVPRLAATLTGADGSWPLAEAWGDQKLPIPMAGRWRNVLTGEEWEGSGAIALAEVFQTFPVALLELVEAA